MSSKEPRPLPNLSPEEVKAILYKLSPDEITVLYFVCLERRVEKVLEEIAKFKKVNHYDEKTYDYHMEKVYRDLGYPEELHWHPKRERLFQQVCPIVREEVKDPKMLRYWPPKVLIEEQKEEQEEENEDDGQGVDFWIRRTLGPRIGLIIAVIILIIAGFICSSWETIRDGLFPPPPPPTITPYPSATPLPPTATFTPTQTPTITPTPTITLTPTNTFTPTPSITPTPNLILFEDNFDSGMSPYWRIHSGDPLVVNNQLTASNETWLFIGDESWTDYTVEFDLDYGRGIGYGDIAVGIVGMRVQDSNNFNYYLYRFVESFWEIIRNGEVSRIPQSETGNIGPPILHIVVTVHGDEYTATTGKVPTSFNNSDFSSGFVAIHFNQHMQLDNFKVTRIP